MKSLSLIKAAAVSVAAISAFAAPSFADDRDGFLDKRGLQALQITEANAVTKTQVADSVGSSTTQAERIAQAKEARIGR